MGYIEIRKLTPADELWVCDGCNQEGVKANGKEVKDSYNDVLLWFCFNCVEREKRGNSIA
jgi:hypothetical protein